MRRIYMFMITEVALTILGLSMKVQMDMYLGLFIAWVILPAAAIAGIITHGFKFLTEEYLT